MTKQKKQAKKAEPKKEHDDLARAKQQARAQLDCILEMLKAFDKAEETGEKVTYEGYEYDADGIRQLMHENALSVEVRDGWYCPGEQRESDPLEYKILLCTGGPAVQITGDVGQGNEAETAELQYQDWFTSWTDYTEMTYEESEQLLRYAQLFYFGA